MNYWIFVVTNQKSAQESLTGMEVYRQRMQDRFWGLGERTPNRANLAAGDRVVFYVGIPHAAFAGTVTLASASSEVPADRATELAHETDIYKTAYGVDLTEIALWDSPLQVASVAEDLNFIENPQKWGAYLQGGVRQITEKDYLTIITSAGNLGDPGDDGNGGLTSGQFAIEQHLEEFMERNWSQIPWGRRLEIYSDGDVSGRQFPAGTWNIDFLAVDKDTNDLVVVELKGGRASDRVVGQALRYMNWIRKHLADENQGVRAIIVAHDVDEALRYAVMGIPQIDVLTYSLSFSLRHESINRF